MTDAAIIVVSGQGMVLLALAGWLFMHEKRCSDRWSRFMREYGEMIGRFKERDGSQ